MAAGKAGRVCFLNLWAKKGTAGALLGAPNSLAGRHGRRTARCFPSRSRPDGACAPSHPVNRIETTDPAVAKVGAKKPPNERAEPRELSPNLAKPSAGLTRCHRAISILATGPQLRSGCPPVLALQCTLAGPEHLSCALGLRLAGPWVHRMAWSTTPPLGRLVVGRGQHQLHLPCRETAEIMRPANTVRYHGLTAQLVVMQRMRAHICPQAAGKTISKCCF
jgi:hypothetical protein